MSFTTPIIWYWALAPLAVAVLALFLLLRAFSHLGNGEIGRAGGHVAGGTVLGLAAFAVGLIVLNTQNYARLAYERPVAEVIVAATDPAKSLYRVEVRRLDRSRLVSDCTMAGDEWLLSARVQKWQPWLNVLGLDSTYALDQIANKYASAERGNGRTIQACDLAGPAPAVNKVMPSWLTNWLMARSLAEQHRFGSAVFMPMTDGAIYRVTMTQSGLNAEAVNPIARQAVQRGV